MNQHRFFAAAALCLATTLASAQSPATPGAANPKEVGKPGTSANSGSGPSGSLNAADAKAADRPASGAEKMKERRDEKKMNAPRTTRPASGV